MIVAHTIYVIFSLYCVELICYFKAMQFATIIFVTGGASESNFC